MTMALDLPLVFSTIAKQFTDYLTNIKCLVLMVMATRVFVMISGNLAIAQYMWIVDEPKIITMSRA